MATVPLSGTNIRLISGVPFSNDYKHTRWFDTPAQQLEYFMGKQVIHQMGLANYQRIEGRNFVSVNKNLDQLWGANYIMFTNADYNGKWFFGFVTKLEYVNKQTTYVHFEIDVFQTWKFQMKFKPSFIVREHSRQYQDDGQPVLNTVDEGLNYGTEYETVQWYKYSPSFGYKWMVIVSKEPFHNDADADNTAGVIGTPQPLTYYVIPYKDNGQTANVYSLSSRDISSPQDVLSELRKNTSAVNNIVSMYVTDYLGLSTTFTEGGNGERDMFKFNGTASSLDIDVVMVGEQTLVHVKYAQEFETLDEVLSDDKYKNFLHQLESKLYMYPYCMIVLDDFKGNRLEIQPEHISGKELGIYVKGSLGTSNKVSYSVKNYNKNHDKNGVAISQEHSLINSRPSDIPILNDMLAAFIQGNRNSLENQVDSTVWNGITGAIGGAIGSIGSAVSGSATGVAGSLTGTVQGAGNSVLAIQGVTAKIKDIDNTPASISKMGGNAIFEHGNRYDGFYIMYKQIKHEYRKKISDFFNVYGYKINEVKNPNFHTRQNWNYVQTESCVITGNFNNDDLQELKKVFDNGITFWHTDDVGNYLLDNEVI